MSGPHVVRAFAAVELPAEAIDEVYRGRFGWPEGRRLPAEAKLTHLACDEAMSKAGLERSRTPPFATTGIVLASEFGGLASYERFGDGMDRRDPQPLAFSFALPGIPASVLSLYYRIRGPVLSLAERQSHCGAVAVREALALLTDGRCGGVIAGSWHFPSTTARQCGGGPQARAAVAIIADDGDGLAVELGRGAQEGSGAGDPWFECLQEPPRSGSTAHLPLGGNLAVHLHGGRHGID